MEIDACLFSEIVHSNRAFQQMLKNANFVGLFFDKLLEGTGEGGDARFS